MFFQEENQSSLHSVPYFEDVSPADGWSGQTTTKSYETLKSNIMLSINRLGGITTSIKKGTFKSEDKTTREGLVILYQIEGAEGKLYPGKIEIAALPTKNSSHKEKSLKMAMYMFDISLKGTWYLQKLSPGYDPLMPFMLVPGKDKTISQSWSESPVFNNNLLPEPNSSFIEGEIVN